MIVQPFGQVCAACLFTEASFRYCTNTCTPSFGPGSVHEMNSAIGQTPRPHLHRSCARCGFEWLEECLTKELAHGGE